MKIRGIFLATLLFFVSAFLPCAFALENLNLTRPVKDSGHQGPYPPELAVDGIDSYGPLSAWVSTNPHPQWLAVDLGAEREFNSSLLLNTRNTSAGNFFTPKEGRLEGSNNLAAWQNPADDSLWEKIADFTHPNACKAEITVFSTVSYRYVRLLIEDTWVPNQNSQIMEWQLFCDPLAANAPLSSGYWGASLSFSTEHPSYQAKYAVDGLSSTGWVPSEWPATNPWLAVEFPEARLVDKIRLDKSTKLAPTVFMPTAYTIEVRTGGIWRQVVSDWGNTEPEALYKLSEPVVATAVKITLHQFADNNNWAYLNEFAVYGPFVPELDLPAETTAGVVRVPIRTQPLATVELARGSEPASSKQADANGRCFFDVPLQPGENHLQARAILGEQTSFYAQATITRTVGAISGTLSDSVGPAAGALVSVKETGQYVFTESDGSYALYLPVGSFNLIYSKAGYETLSVPVTVALGESRQLDQLLQAGSAEAPEAPAGLQIKAEKGTVHLSWQPDPAASYYNVYRAAVQGTPSPDTLKFSHLAGNTGGVQDQDIVSGQTYYYLLTAENEFGAESQPAAFAAVTPRFSGGTVVERNTLLPISGAEVYVDKLGSKVYTDDEGRFVLDLQEDQSYAVSVYKEGYKKAQAALEQDETLQIVLEPLQTVREAVSLSEVYLSGKIFSPNGDGVRDSVSIFFMIGNDEQVAPDAEVKIRVYNLTGRLVKTVLAATLPVGGHQASWAGTDEAGRKVPSGLYLLRIEVGTNGTSAKPAITLPIVVIR